MTPEDQADLDKFLKIAEEYMTHLSLDDRVQVINDIKNEVTESSEVKSVRVQDVLKTYPNHLDLINRHLVQRGLPRAKNRKKRNIIKVILLSMVIIALVLTLSVLLLLKSFTPIFEFNENDGTITYFGDRFVFEPDDSSFFNHTRLRDYKDSVREVKHTGKLETIGVRELVLNGVNSDLAIRQHPHSSVDYKCESNVQPRDMVERVEDVYTLRLPDASQCMFFVPVDLTITGKFKNGFVNLRDLKQDINITLESGHVSWKQVEQQMFSISIDASRNKIEGDLNGFEKQAPYQAIFQLGSGSINVRK